MMISDKGEEMPIYSLGEKKPQLPEQDLYWVAPDAHVIGNVILGRDVGIWFGSVLRGDNDVSGQGPRKNYQNPCKDSLKSCENLPVLPQGFP